MNNKILIVEDERAIREMLSLYLSKQYQVIEAEDYQSAINKLGEKTRAYFTGLDDAGAFGYPFN